MNNYNSLAPTRRLKSNFTNLAGEFLISKQGKNPTMTDGLEEEGQFHGLDVHLTSILCEYLKQLVT